MRYFVFIFLALFSFFPMAWADDQSQDGPFAVVELFSSEDCSVCPSAYQLVTQFADSARDNNQSIYFLDFHVDYFNNKGWQDSYSRTEFSRRQYGYDHILNSNTYTPQMVVNGRDVFVGNDQDRLQQGLDNALANPPSVVLDVSLAEKDFQYILNYSCKGFTADDEIHVALVESGLSTYVTAGENAGRTIHHDNVVRGYWTWPLTQTPMKVQIPVDNISDTSQASVIVYVQNADSYMIKDAKQLDLKNAED